MLICHVIARKRQCLQIKRPNPSLGRPLSSLMNYAILVPCCRETAMKRLERFLGRRISGPGAHAESVLTLYSNMTHYRFLRSRSVTVIQSGLPSPPSEHPRPAPVEQAREIQSLSQRQPSSSITLKGIPCVVSLTVKNLSDFSSDFTVCGLPTKKYLNLLYPRARVKVRVGNRTFISPTVRMGKQPADGTGSRTHWNWNFSQ